ncbi:unnamed protein product [Symbiodinium natans]|uniref:Zeta toxin domain-containing protein n=1 Tax=Symbiodinium natans TaxID=878477 RepID=A0A812SC83_9DINO|nr:unnamed protein product [Symbiodinium natans]
MANVPDVLYHRFLKMLLKRGSLFVVWAPACRFTLTTHKQASSRHEKCCCGGERRTWAFCLSTTCVVPQFLQVLPFQDMFELLKDHSCAFSQASAADMPRKTAGVVRSSSEQVMQPTAANFFDATSEQGGPIALWILGPSSVGKSTITVDVAPSFGIPRAGGTLEQADRRRQLDAVVIDGEYMRDAHAVWQAWIETDDWRSAYPALKAFINKEKDDMCAEAVSRRKNLIIPQTALKLPKALAEMERIKNSGYTNHVLAVVAPLVECQRRGQKRELSTGKRYQPDEFERSISAIPPLIAACNGRFRIVRARERPGTSHRMDFETLQEGSGGTAESGLSSPQMTADEDLEAIIRKAVDTPVANQAAAVP